MKKVIGVVCEGPTDFLIIRKLTDYISGEKNTYRMLQPEPDMAGEYGNGWKGVLKWCRDHSQNRIIDIMKGITPAIDAIIIQMDGDVARKEKEVHCMCESVSCSSKGRQFPLFCGLLKSGQCPAGLPCMDHEPGPSGFRTHLENVIRQVLCSNDEGRIVITIPCDSTESWIISAYGDSEFPEETEDPWKNVISLKKEYHEIRVRNKKNKRIYEQFSVQVLKEWEHVTHQCRSAELFDRSIRGIFSR